mmetsp:Transcript_22306/g.88541  ORF Transcript_22306/g.88541 Transcript_22306/m.88541 type:complete len:641 (+) Transcript_22306:193-2115(+)
MRAPWGCHQREVHAAGGPSSVASRRHLDSWRRGLVVVADLLLPYVGLGVLVLRGGAGGGGADDVRAQSDDQDERDGREDESRDAVGIFGVVAVVAVFATGNAAVVRRRGDVDDERVGDVGDDAQETRVDGAAVRAEVNDVQFVRARAADHDVGRAARPGHRPRREPARGGRRRGRVAERDDGGLDVGGGVVANVVEVRDGDVVLDGRAEDDEVVRAAVLHEERVAVGGGREARRDVGRARVRRGDAVVADGEDLDAAVRARLDDYERAVGRGDGVARAEVVPVVRRDDRLGDRVELDEADRVGRRAVARDAAVPERGRAVAQRDVRRARRVALGARVGVDAARAAHVALDVEVLVAPRHGDDVERGAVVRREVVRLDAERVDVDAREVRVLARRGPRVVGRHGVELDPAVRVAAERLVRERDLGAVEAPRRGREDVEVARVADRVVGREAVDPELGAVRRVVHLHGPRARGVRAEVEPADRVEDGDLAAALVLRREHVRAVGRGGVEVAVVVDRARAAEARLAQLADVVVREREELRGAVIREDAHAVGAERPEGVVEPGHVLLGRRVQVVRARQASPRAPVHGVDEVGDAEHVELRRRRRGHRAEQQRPADDGATGTRHGGGHVFCVSRPTRCTQRVVC